MSKVMTATNPRTGKTDYEFTADDVDSAARDLREHQPAWDALGLEGRAEALTRFADSLAQHRDAIIAALSTDTGRSRIAAQEVDGVIGMIHGWVAQSPHLLPSEDWTPGRAKPHMKHLTAMIPYPLVGVISPWNFPVTLSFIDTVPALLAGCAVLVKPSEVTPRFVDPLRLAIPDDIPMRFVRGGGQTGAEVVMASDCICFTGSVETGKKVALAAAANLIPANLELGGKDPLVVLAGADLETAAHVALRASVLATGQACQSIERVLVHDDDLEPFATRLAELAADVPLAIGNEPPGAIGPFIFPEQAAKVQAQIDDAVARGAKVLSGGKVEVHGGTYLRPTVLTHLTPDMDILREETFGPVIPVIGYANVDEAVALANATQFGLSAAVIGPDEESALAVARRLDAGAVSLQDAALTNQYFEAPKQSFKSSGLGGSRMGPDGFARFFRKKAYIANTAEPLKLEEF